MVHLHQEIILSIRATSPALQTFPFPALSEMLQQAILLEHQDHSTTMLRKKARENRTKQLPEWVSAGDQIKNLSF
jgi:hypothetical protein